jgi:hypothetical protein
VGESEREREREMWIVGHGEGQYVLFLFSFCSFDDRNGEKFFINARINMKNFKNFLGRFGFCGKRTVTFLP